MDAVVIAMVSHETTDVQWPLVVSENELMCFNIIAYIDCIWFSKCSYSENSVFNVFSLSPVFLF